MHEMCIPDGYFEHTCVVEEKGIDYREFCKQFLPLLTDVTSQMLLIIQLLLERAFAH